MKKILILLLISCQILFLSSCWGNEEINDHAIVGVLAADKTTDGNIKISAVILKPTGASGSGSNSSSSQMDKPFFVVSATGKTVSDAKRSLQMHVPRLLYWDNCEFIIIGENMAKSGIKSFIDFCRKSVEIRERVNFFVSKGNAEDILNPLIYIANTSNIALKAYIDNAYINSKSYQYSNLNILAQSLLGTGTKTVLGEINVMEPTNINEKESQSLVKKYELLYEGAAVFKKDVLVGWLNGTEARGLQFIYGRAKMGTFVFTCPVGDKKVMATINSMREKSKIKPVKENGKIKFKVDINAEGDLLEWDSDISLDDPDLVKSVNKEYANAIKAEVETTLNKAQQEYKTDFCGFGDELYKHKPKQWEKVKDNWDEVFSSAEIEVNVKTNINKIGLTH